MKKILALLLIVSLLACSLPASFAEEAQLPAGSVPEAGFSGMGDPNLLRYTEDTIYENLVATLDSDEYFVENVSAVYISQEYIDELAYNSQANIYFGYTLQELAEQFQGTKYIFTLGDDGSTIVTEFEEYDDTYDRALKNVAIGTGVILVCVTVSVVTAGTGASAISIIFSAAAKGGIKMALSGGALGGVSAGIVTGVQTGDWEEALKAAALAGSKEFKWGAIAGAINSGVGKAISLRGDPASKLTPKQLAIIQKATKYPLDVIKEFDSTDEYEVCLDAGLIARMVGGAHRAGAGRHRPRLYERTAGRPGGVKPDENAGRVRSPRLHDGFGLSAVPHRPERQRHAGCSDGNAISGQRGHFKHGRKSVRKQPKRLCRHPAGFLDVLWADFGERPGGLRRGAGKTRRLHPRIPEHVKGNFYATDRRIWRPAVCVFTRRRFTPSSPRSRLP